MFLFKSRLIQDTTYIRILYLLYDKLASYLSRVLCKSRLILSRINGPNVCKKIKDFVANFYIA